MELDDILHGEEVCSNKSNASSAICAVTTARMEDGEASFPMLMLPIYTEVEEQG